MTLASTIFVPPEFVANGAYTCLTTRRQNPSQAGARLVAHPPNPAAKSA